MAKVIILLVFSQYLGAAVPVFAVVLYFLQRFYLRTSRQIRLLGIEAKAPLYTRFLESTSGAATIRAFGWQSHYQDGMYQVIDTSQRPVYFQSCIQHWLTFMLDVIVAALSAVLVAVVTTWKGDFSPGSAGVSLVMIVGFNSTLSRLITNWTATESSVGAVARVRRFVTRTETEDKGHGTVGIVAQWPQSGAVLFTDVIASYPYHFLLFGSSSLC